MRKVVAFQFLSLDGVAERPDSFLTDWDDVMDASRRHAHRDAGRGYPRPP